MARTFSSLHARAFSHATEDLEKVMSAMSNALGEVKLATTRTEGHHGNPITVLEASLDDQRSIDEFFERLSEADLKTLAHTLGTRVDDSCNLFLKLDKQEASIGRTVLGGGDDVISVRLKVRAFPAKRGVAEAVIGEYLKGVLAARGAGS